MKTILLTAYSFSINWWEVGKAFGYFALGIIVFILFLCWLFKDWRPY